MYEIRQLAGKRLTHRIYCGHLQNMPEKLKNRAHDRVFKFIMRKSVGFIASVLLQNILCRNRKRNSATTL